MGKYAGILANVFAKSLIRSLCPSGTSSAKSQRNYLCLQAHPDDEILISATQERIIKYSENPRFITLTDGNKNTDINRLKEFQDSFRARGYFREVECLSTETSILDLISTEQGQPTEISDVNLKRASEIIETKINQLGNRINRCSIDTILVPDFSGGHFIHDLANMVGVLAARKVSEKRKIEVYEFPQYFMISSSDIPAQDVQSVIQELDSKMPDYNRIKEIAEKNKLKIEKKEDLGLVCSFWLGEFVTRKTKQIGLDDPAIAMYDGILKINFREFLKKNEVKNRHKSQKKSIGRLLKHLQRVGDMSVEKLRKVPLDRDFSEKPLLGPLLYEVIPWRSHCDYKTFSRIYKELNQKN